MTTQQFINFTRQHRNHLLHIAMQYLADTDDCEDAVQDALIKLWALKGKPDSDEDMVRYATTAVKHTALNLLRDRQRHQAVDPAYFADGIYTMRADTAIEQAETKQHLRHAIATLSAADRTLLKMRNIEHLSYTEIAAMLGISETGVRSRISRLRKSLINRINI